MEEGTGHKEVRRLAPNLLASKWQSQFLDLINVAIGSGLLTTMLYSQYRLVKGSEACFFFFF